MNTMRTRRTRQSQRYNLGLATMGSALLPCGLLAAAGLLAWSVARPSPAAACGGLFCNNNQPVNQTAERILFVDNGDGTTTAVIEIQYQGPAERFAWVLPVPSIENPDEDIKVSSTQALDRLQQATNPRYSLTVTFDGDCRQANPLGAAGLDFAPAEEAMADPTDGGVVVEASGSVGPFAWQLLDVDETLSDPAQTAVDWMEDNDYDISGIGTDLLRPYLQAGNRLLAVRLVKGNDTGAIRPLMIT